ncbi:MAG: N-acetylmuramoyl-L-alanine amidase [Actinobacteria bacterium]|nr:MAG: N-acetylmuramoyl-L-alanine amidase [Actinomycetota bacterium]
MRRQFRALALAPLLAALAILGVGLPSAAAAGAVPSGYSPVVPQPPIVNALMNNATAAKYKSDISAYSLRHYGEYTYALRPQAVVLHYTVSGAGSWRAIINGWDVPWASGSNTGGEQPQPAAHFIVEQDGTIYQTMPLDLRVRHAYGMNHVAIGIEFIELSSATNIINRARQYQAGLALVRWLQYEYGIPTANIAGHGTANDSPLFYDRTGLRNDHTDWNAAEVGRFTSDLGFVPVKDGGPGPGTITKVHAGPANSTVFGNLTAAAAQKVGYTQVFNCADGPPASQALNSIYYPTPPTPVMAMAQTDGNGDICLLNSQQTHLIWDQYYAGPQLGGHQATRMMSTLSPYGSRPTGPLPAGQSIAVQTNRPNETIMGTLTAWGPSTAGHLRAYPCSEGLPPTSAVNFADRVATNFVAVRADSAGKVCFYTSATTHVVWDQVAETAALAAHVGVRKYDAREPMVGGASQGNNGHRNAPGEVVRIQASDHRTTVFGNLTVANPLNPGHTVLYPCDQPKPATSVNNFLGGRNNANAAMVRTDAAGFICASSNEWAHLIWDQVAESDDVTASPAPVRLLDTRR